MAPTDSIMREKLQEREENENFLPSAASNVMDRRILLRTLFESIQQFPDQGLRRYITKYLQIKGNSQDTTSNKDVIKLVKKLVKNFRNYQIFSKDKGARWMAGLIITMLQIEEIKMAGTDSEALEDLILTFPEIITEATSDYDNDEIDPEKKLAKTRDNLRLRAQMQCYQADTRRKVQGKPLWKPGTEKALNDPKRAKAYLIPITFGFPEVAWEPDQGKVLDPNRPTVCFHGLSTESLSRARALDKRGEVNVIITTKLEFKEEQNESDGQTCKKISNIQEGMMFRDGKLYLVPFKEKIKLDYVISGGRMWSKEYQDIPFCGSGLSTVLPNHKLTMPSANYRKRKPIGIRMPCNYGYPQKVGKKGIRLNIRKIDSPEMMNDPNRYIWMVHDFFTRNPHMQKCVMKPLYGTSGGFGVWIINRSEVCKGPDEVYETFMQTVSTYITHCKEVMLEPFIKPYPIAIDGEAVDWNIRVFVSRDARGNISVEKGKVVRYGPKNVAINISNGGSAVSMDSLENQIPEFHQLMARIDRVAIAQIDNLEKFAEKKYATSDDDTKKTDLFGLDMIITKTPQGRLIPVTIEWGSWNVGCLWNAEQSTDPSKWESFTEKFTSNVIARAKEHFAASAKH